MKRFARHGSQEPELRNVATVLLATKHAGKYVEEGNETLRTENESKRMSAAMFHDVDVKSEARDNKRLTSKENKSKKTLHFKNDKKEMLASIEIKGELREHERLTLHDENIVGARPNVSEAHGKYGGDGAPNSNGERTSTHPKNEFSKAETT